MLHSNQFHLGSENQGFVPIRTLSATQPKWTLEVGPVGYGSPVIGPDGVIYIGTLTGDLVAVLPDGTLNWRRKLVSQQGFRYPGIISGSPAVGLDNHIYVITTANVTIRNHRNGEESVQKIRRSCLHRVSSQGEITWSYAFPKNASPTGLGAYTSSSPKVWGNPPFIFVPAIYKSSGHAIELLVIDQDGRMVHRTDIASYAPGPITGESNIDDVLEAIWDFISSPVDFDTSGVDTGAASLEELFGLPEPTIAIMDNGDFAQQPLVIYDDAYKALSVFQFQPPILKPMWKKVSEKVRFRSSPAVPRNGVIVIGDKNGTISQYLTDSGDEYGKPWFKANKSVVSPVASFGRQIYFVAQDTVYVLDSDSSLWKQHRIGKTLAAPALSANHLYISSADGLYTFSFDLSEFERNRDVKGGVSSPVIGDDGVYVVDLQGVLWAF